MAAEPPWRRAGRERRVEPGGNPGRPGSLHISAVLDQEITDAYHSSPHARPDRASVRSQPHTPHLYKTLLVRNRHPHSSQVLPAYTSTATTTLNCPSRSVSLSTSQINTSPARLEPPKVYNLIIPLTSDIYIICYLPAFLNR